MKNILLALISLLLFASCSPRYITKTEKQTDTLYYTKYLRDSIYLHDSINTFVYTSGDTVYVNKFKSVIRYKERLKTDTLRQIKQVTKVDTEVIEVKKKNSWFTNFIFGLLSGGLLLLILEICLLKNNRKT